MMRTLKAIVFAVSTALATSLATAQSTLLVGPGGYPDVTAALAAAAPGDEIEVAAGSYPAFQCAIGVTIRAAVPGTVTIVLDGGVFAPNGYPMQFSAPAGQSVRLVGLRFGMPSGSLIASGLPEITFACAIALEDCEFNDLAGGPSRGRGLLRVSNGAFSHWQNVRVAGPGVLVEGKLTAVQSELVGTFSLGLTNDAMRVVGTLLASHGSFVGGTSSTQPAGAGILVHAGARVWLTDCTIDRGASFSNACSLVDLGGQIDLTRCTSAVTPACLPVGSGAGLGVQRSGPIAQGLPFSIDYRTGPGVPVAVLASFQLADVVLPGLLQPWAAPQSAFNAAFGFANAQGDLTFSFTLPAVPSFQGLPLWFHGVGGVSLPLQVAAPVGGLVR
ncbi:MAG: hypothetical protein IT456_27265 [Planctomycetes bacterium]|jgi:hypothetical protein|nr:hypothetical protein [Planctomycetota bacterium]